MAAETTDPVLSQAAEEARELITKLASGLGVDTVRVFVTDFESSNREALDQLYTDGCMAVFRIVPEPLIICNAAFLGELEGVLRSFHFPNSYMQSDEAMFAFVNEVATSPGLHLARVRKRIPPPEEDFEEHMVQHMKLLMFFFGAHELGHIMGRQNKHDFIANLSGNLPLEHRIATSVVKLCMHAEDFHNVGFRLPFLEDVADTESRIRAVESDLRRTAKLDVAFANFTTFFSQEARADEIATALIVDYFNKLETENRILALEEQQLFVRSLSFIGLYTWYKDLSSFIMRGCLPLEVKNSTQLMICMMRSRQQYIWASSLFGNVHRSIILRAYLVTAAIVEERLNFLSIPKEERTIWVSQKELDQLSEEEFAVAIWRSGTLQNHALLEILMDTPIKFSYVGCATGWFTEIDKKRDIPQLLIMDFETLEQSIERLTRLQ